MYKIIASIVLYNNKISEIKDLLTEFYKNDINQKLVIIDNSETNKLEKEIEALNSSVDYIHNRKNSGYGSGNNIAISKYKGKAKYFLVLNPDIFFILEDLEKLIKYADTKENFGIISPKILFPDRECQYSCKLLPGPGNLIVRRFLSKLKFMKKTVEKMDYNYEFKFTDYNREMEVPFMSGCFMFFDYENLMKEKGFDERYFMYMEDVDLSRRMFKYGNYFYPEVEITHVVSRGSYKSSKMAKIHMKSAIQYFNKWGWFFDSEKKEINNSVINKYKKGQEL